MRQKEYAVIVAGGRGTRISSAQPKQFLELAGKPVILHTLEVFSRYSDSITIVLVLPEDDFNTWHEIAKRYHFQFPLILQAGGPTRFQSVKKGLQRISDDQGLVAVHDGVRPLVSTEIIAASFRWAKEHKAAVASVALKDSIRKTDTDAPSKALDRSLYRLIQTPQTFEVRLLRKAYEREEDPALTDDASVVENDGNAVYLFEGDYKNIKITTAEDLVVAEALIHTLQKKPDIPK